ncbi:MAG: T9SS type A sorting domain-containing protein [Bacteroidota bacterium]|nr:T9SS type A sorting domain-containing protein [Bacteroidota bacterium]
MHSVDGGITWSKQIDIIPTSSLLYLNSTNRLVLAYEGGPPAYLYSTDGVSFSPVSLGNVSTIGIAFSDNKHGVMSPGPITPLGITHSLYTSDGGITWFTTPLDADQENFQPIGIKGTTTFYSLSESARTVGTSGVLRRSDDGGITWRKIYQYSVHWYGVTGTLQYNSKALFFQTIPDGSEGIMMSGDSGKTFYSICGPTNNQDTRFYVRDSFIYAGDKSGKLWLNTTGIGSNSTPQLSIAHSISFQTDACKPKDSIITITFFDSCNGNQAKLLSAAISGPSDFSLPAPFSSPRALHSNDSILVRYDPGAKLPDSATLRLRFHLGWKDFDTVIQLRGSASANPVSNLSLTQLHFPFKCASRDSLITFSFYDSCTGAQATLDSINLQGSSAFSILAPLTLPRAVHGDDSLVVRYAPASFGSDTATVRLHFHLGAVNIDTVIMLFGKKTTFPVSDFSATTIDLPFHCTASDSLITFSYFDSCTGAQATLLRATISDSEDFSLLRPTLLPRTVHANDSLLISYHPSASHKDTAALLLDFQLGDEFFDTVIMLYGTGRIPIETVQFIPSLSSSSAAAGSYIDLLIKPDRSLSNRGLQSISFDVIYYGDLFEIVSSSSPNLSLLVTTGTKMRNGKIETLPVTITGKDITLDSTEPIAVIKLWVMLTDTTSTAITMSNLKLNNDDSDYKNCILSADAGNTNFTLLFDCGDSSIYKYLRTGSVLEITSIRPNPAQDEVQIDVQSAVRQDASIEIRNALGVQVYSDAKSLVSGSNSIHLDTKGLASGMYFVRVGGVSRSVVISR